MKRKLIIWLVIFLAPFFVSLKGTACDFHFEINDQKTSYQIGDEVIITVSVILTHRVCEIELEDTQFKVEGMEITGATKWVQVSDKIYARKFKIKITDNNSPAIFSASRDCDRDGGSGSLKLKIT